MPDARYMRRVSFAFRPGYRLFLRLKRFEDAIPLLFDDIVLDRASLRSTFGTGLYEDCRHGIFSRAVVDRGSIAQS
jgi:hypothetical protein